MHGIFKCRMFTSETFNWLPFTLDNVDFCLDANDEGTANAWAIQPSTVHHYQHTRQYQQTKCAHDLLSGRDMGRFLTSQRNSLPLSSIQPHHHQNGDHPLLLTSPQHLLQACNSAGGITHMMPNIAKPRCKKSWPQHQTILTSFFATCPSNIASQPLRQLPLPGSLT